MVLIKNKKKEIKLKSFKYISLLGIIFFFTACSNKELRTSYKNERYSIIKGINASQGGNFSLAIEEYSRAYFYNSKNLFTLRELGMLYALTGDLKSSEIFYNKALNINNRDAVSILNLAILYYNQDRYKESLNLILTMPVESISIDSKKLKGFNYYSLNNLKEAYNELSSIAKKITNDLEFIKIYYNLLLEMNEIYKLHSYIYNIYMNDKTNPEYILLYCRHLVENLGKIKEAEEIYKNYLIHNGINRDLVVEFSNLEYNRGNYLKARKYIRLLPNKFRYNLQILELEKNIYRKLNDFESLKEIETLLTRLKKE